MNPFKQFEHVLKDYINEKGLFELSQKWNEPFRFYHNINHLIQIIQDIQSNVWFSELNVFEKHVLLLAAFYHAAIYNPKQKDNEDQSIIFFKKSYKGRNPNIVSEVSNLIEITKHRKRPYTKLGQIFWDADNVGFKKGYDTLLQNEKLIRKEYSFVPKKEYKENRISFLQSNLGLFGNSVDKNLNKLIEYVKKTY